MNYQKIIDLLYSSVISEGGDGDAKWLSRFKTLDDIIVLLNEYNINNKTGWEININDGYILWGDNQEWVFITCDKDLFENEPRMTLNIIC